jgi:hypothetical protein
MAMADISLAWASTIPAISSSLGLLTAMLLRANRRTRVPRRDNEEKHLQGKLEAIFDDVTWYRDRRLAQAVRGT